MCIKIFSFMGIAHWAMGIKWASMQCNFLYYLCFKNIGIVCPALKSNNDFIKIKENINEGFIFMRKYIELIFAQQIVNILVRFLFLLQIFKKISAHMLPRYCPLRNVVVWVQIDIAHLEK